MHYTSPSFDSAEWATYIKKYCLPTIITKTIIIPNELSQAYLLLDFQDEVDPSLVLAICTGLALGLSQNFQ